MANVSCRWRRNDNAGWRLRLIRPTKQSTGPVSVSATGPFAGWRLTSYPAYS
ncbi:hypothetical protein CKO_04846 [Citrobacter koseri ATCC BAA-895]|uniref:Uncharacterized protein n=1 Tax=Citrobacter koseri (strain ATCC BAA-895 / CDC 4225-83 / SGSC4696) TaxID=290338 RepID=A8AQX8_CITK8|nr:hypothetical protein CKO_04846 [Citrobacter koseri ATCC BAA-895]